METVYRVTTEGDCEGRTTSVLGFCTGNPKDIEAYFEKHKEYSIKVEPLKVLHITKELVDERNSLLEEQKLLNERLASVNKRLGS